MRSASCQLSLAAEGDGDGDGDGDFAACMSAGISKYKLQRQQY
jgi:hypothetical protein